MPVGLNIGLFSYSLIGLIFSLLSFLLVTRWKGRLNSALFFVFCVVSAIWAFTIAYAAQNEHAITLAVILSELCRDLVWAIFLIRLIVLLNPDIQKSPLFQLARKLAYAIPVFLILLIIILKISNVSISGLGYELRILGQIAIAVVGFSLIEQVFRNTGNEHRWAMKFFCLGVGTFYAFDFYLYSDAFLFKQMDYVLWFARPWVYLIALILIFIAMGRNPIVQSNISVSRGVVFYTSVVIMTGIYLLIMSAGGFYLQQFGGDWGKIAAVSFLFAGLLFLLILIFSGHTRARIHVFIDKHFLDFKYDYREQWLGLIRELSSDNQARKIEERALHAITEMMGSSGGSLWVRKNQRQYTAIAQFGMDDIDEVMEDTNGSLANYLESWQWVINLQEYQTEPELYQDLLVPDWLKDQKDAWLVVPLMLQAKLYGFIIILRPRAEKQFNWEDIDLLKTAGRQVAIHLAQQRSALALVQARQFEAFNRFSAYVVHDLKNLVSQLALVVKNAEKHKHNPAFMDDAIDTVDNAVDRMNRLLAQLRAGAVDKIIFDPVNLCGVLNAVVNEKSHDLPKPILNCEKKNILIRADETRLISVIGHIVQNAQDATADDGEISISARQENGNALITVSDSGCGMDQKFIAERLFKPFDTTKGLTGMGIGAHESRSFIEDLGGSLNVKSEVDKGSIFYIELPLIHSDDEDQPQGGVSG